MKELVFIKLGGSLITDKTRPYTPLLDVMDDLALQITTTLQAQPDLRLVIGHGAGSFGHVAASEYKTRDGYPRASQLIHRERDHDEEHYWKGFAEVWYQASSLNRYVMDALPVLLPAMEKLPSGRPRPSAWHLPHGLSQ